MMRLLRAESYKLVHSRLTWIIVVVLLILVIYLGRQIDFEAKSFAENQIERYNFSRMLSLVNRQFMLDDVDGDRSKLQRDEFNFWDTDVTTTSILTRAIEGTLLVDEKQQAQIALRRWKNLLIGADQDWLPANFLHNRGEDRYTLQYIIIRQEYLIEQEIYETSAQQIDAWSMQADLRRKGIGLAIALGSFMLTLQLFSEEFNSGSYLFYYSQPFVRRKIILSKIVMVPIIVIGLFIITYLFAFLGTGFYYGFGNALAPEVYHSVSLADSIKGTPPQLENLTIIPIWKALTYSTILDLNSVILVSIVLIAIYQVSKSQMITLVLSVFLIATHYLISMFADPTTKLFEYWPASLIHSLPSITGRQISKNGLWVMITFILGVVSVVVILKSFIHEDLERRFN